MPTSTPAVAAIMDYYVKGAIGLLEGTDRLEVRVEASATDIGIGFGAVGKKGSTIATFIAAQAPSDFALVERLPAGPAPVVMTGKVLLGPLRADAIALIEKFLIGTGVPWNPELTALMNTWADSATGDMAAVLEMVPGRMRMAQLMGAENPVKLHAAVAAALQSWAGKTIETTTMGIKTLYTMTPDALAIDGVSFHRYVSKVDTSKMTPEQAAASTAMGKEFVGLVGAWDDVMGVIMSGDEAAARALVEASRGKGERLALSPRVTSDLAAARARKESLYYFLDFGSMMAAMAPAAGIKLPGSIGLAMTAGFANGTAQIRFAMKSAELKAVVAAARGAQP
jgi:hypothetical protein